MINRKNPLDLLLIWLGTVGVSKEDADNLMKGKDLSLAARSSRPVVEKEAPPVLKYRIQETDFGMVAVVKHPYGVETEELIRDEAGNTQKARASGRVYNQTVLRTMIKARQNEGKDTAQEEKILQEVEAATEKAGLSEIADKIRVHGFLTGGLDDGMFYISHLTDADPQTGDVIYPQGTTFSIYPDIYTHERNLTQPPSITLTYPPRKLQIN